MWLVAGLFLDGWAHNNRPALESFFTPWHAAFYSGFAACVVWIGLVVKRRLSASRSFRDAVPVGYGVAVIGLVVFAVGGAGDLTWHTIFGIEQDFDALFSPTHLMLFVGIMLIVTTPVRAARATHWSGSDVSKRPVDLVQIAVTLGTGLVLFFVQYLSLFNESFEQLSRARLVAAPPPGVPAEFLEGTLERAVLFGAIGLIVSASVVCAPVAWLVRERGHRPGSVVFHVGLLAVTLSAVTGFEDPQLILGALVSASAIDAFASIATARMSFRVARHLVAGAAPALLLGGHAGAIALTDGIGLEAEIWTGTIVLASLAGVALSILAEPPRVLDDHPPERPKASKDISTGGGHRPFAGRRRRSLSLLS